MYRQSQILLDHATKKIPKICHLETADFCQNLFDYVLGMDRLVSTPQQGRGLSTHSTRNSLFKPKYVGNQTTKRVNQLQNSRQLVTSLHSQKAVMGSGHDPLNVKGRTAASSSIVTRGILTNGKSSQEGKSGKLATGEIQDCTNDIVCVNKPRSDVALLTEEIPPDGVLFGRLRSNINTLVVFRTPDERARNPERLNLDRRQLDVCPLLESEHRLRLLNYQNNSIQVIQNLENLPNLIFLDLYNNKISTLDGPLSSLKTLRVLMAGKNRITSISNLTNLKKLDVLDLHSNEIAEIGGFDSLSDLRVLNLAGNFIKTVRNLSSLQSLTELNLRRNDIEFVQGLDDIPSLQRIFLSHNKIDSMDNIECIFHVKYLLELSLDGNPISVSQDTNEVNGENDMPSNNYRLEVISRIAGLRHLDLLRVTEEERKAVFVEAETSSTFESAVGTPQFPMGMEKFKSNPIEADENSRSPKNMNSYYDLARLGRLNSSNSLFEIEPYEGNEKLRTVVVSGEVGEFNQSKRLFQNVVEIVMINMNKEVIFRKFGPLMISFSSLKIVRMICNDICSLQDLQIIFESITPCVEHVSITNNPICAVSQLCLVCLYFSPDLLLINDLDVTTVKKSTAVYFMDPFFRIYGSAKNYSKSQRCSNRNEISPARNRRLITPSNTKRSINDEESGSLAKDLTTDCIRSAINKYSLGKQYIASFTSTIFEYTKEIEYLLRISS